MPDKSHESYDYSIFGKLLEDIIASSLQKEQKEIGKEKTEQETKPVSFEELIASLQNCSQHDYTNCVNGKCAYVDSQYCFEDMAADAVKHLKAKQEPHILTDDEAVKHLEKSGWLKKHDDDMMKRLSEQKPRPNLLSIDSLPQYKGKQLWLEMRPDIDQKGLEKVIMTQFNHTFHAVKFDRCVTALSLIDYKKTWRCWADAKPTDDERKAALWI